MTFLNPLYLFGLAAAGIPIVIHLLTRKRPRRVPFASVEFLREVNVAQLRRFRLREFLLLALRVLALALFALSLARPAVRGALGGKGGNAASSVVLLVDRSASMGAVESRTRLSDRALARARAVLDALEPGDEVQVVPFDARPEPLLPAPTADHARVAKALESIAPRPFPTDLDAAVNEGLDALRRRPRANRELFLVSDLQAAGIAATDSTRGAGSAVAAGALTGLRFYVLPVGEGAHPANLGLSDARLRAADVDAFAPPTGAAIPGTGTEAMNAAAGEQPAVEVGVKSFGAPSGDVAVGVRADGRELGRAFVPMGAGEGTALVPLAAMPAAGGEAFLPDDELDADNHRWFASGALAHTQVGFVDGNPAGNSPLAVALAAGQEAGQVESRRLEGADLTPGSLAGLDVVLVNDVPELPDGALAALVDYERGGGAIAVVLGPRAHPEFWSQRFLRALSGMSVGAPRDAGQGAWALRLAAPGHPAFVGFASHPGEPLTQAAFHRAWTLSPGPSARVLARFAPDLPALVEDGRLLVFASDAEGAWNDFPSRGAFLPLWLQSLRALARGSASEDWKPGDRFSVPVPVGEKAPDLRLTDPTGREVPLAQSVEDGARRLSSPPLTELGLYHLSAGARALKAVPVNLDPRESDLTRLTADQARRHWSALKPVVLEGGVDLARRIREDRFGHEVGGLLLLLAFLCLVAETIIGRLMTPAPGAVGSVTPGAAR
jgi:hypothetical protein